MITLYTFPGQWGINPSPFCYKVEVYLKLAGLPFQAVTNLPPFKAPKGKLPFITDNGNTIADSAFILEYLRRTYGDMDAGLSGKQLALAHLLRRTCEESLYWVAVHSRWIDDRYWPIFRDIVFGGVPAPLRPVVSSVIRRRVGKAMRAQGYGRHQPDELYEMGVADLRAIATCLGETPFAVAERPTSVDASLYAFLVNIDRAPVADPLQAFVRGEPAVVEYLKRMGERVGG